MTTPSPARLRAEIEWMTEEREYVLSWLVERRGETVDPEEVLFLFGVIHGQTTGGPGWCGTCECGAARRSLTMADRITATENPDLLAAEHQWDGTLIRRAAQDVAKQTGCDEDTAAFVIAQKFQAATKNLRRLGGFPT